MDTVRLTLRCERFTRDKLAAVVGELSGASNVREPVDQVRYLALYLSGTELATRTMLVERPYVDRHWMEEYAGYYATMLAPPAQKTARLHFFAEELELDDILAVLRELATGATTALWSALAKVMRNDGQRHPTPLAITRAATEHGVQSRAFPASAGLDLEQMASAIHRTGYQPHVFQVSDQFESFILALGCYLRSGIPVVARVRSEQGDHAMTLAGFRHEDALGERDIMIRSQRPSYTLRARGIARWYVHDDRLGPYARLDFKEKSLEGSQEVTWHELCFVPQEAGFEAMRFVDALVPLYPKLRLTAEELIDFAFDMLPWMSYLAKTLEHEDGLHVEPRFALGGDYLAELHSKPIDAERKIAFVTTTLLSRYVGILSWFVGEEWICDVVHDTTDLRRDPLSEPPILGIIPRYAAWVNTLEQFRQEGLLGARPVIA